MHSHQYGVCPVCNGSGRVPAGTAKYKEITAGYDKETDTLACGNCGGQTMSMKATGKVPLRSDGTPCVHKYFAREAGRCYVVYTCEDCGDSYGIDSGD